jgi:hypothetical protein
LADHGKIGGPQCPNPNWVSAATTNLS